MSRWLQWVGSLLVGSLLVGPLLPGAAAADVATLKAGVFDPPRLAPDFALPGTAGGELSLHAYRGKVVLLGFGFTSCKAVCPITLSTLAQVQTLLGAKAADVQVIYITVDPEHDDVARMKAYLEAFNPAFVGGTGSEDQLAAVRRAYGVAAEKVAGADGAFTHSSSIYLIDREGRLRAMMPYGRPAADYVHDIELLLAAP